MKQQPCLDPSGLYLQNELLERQGSLMLVFVFQQYPMRITYIMLSSLNCK